MNRIVERRWIMREADNLASRSIRSSKIYKNHKNSQGGLLGSALGIHASFQQPEG
jgi:hypothetical protein